MPASEPPISGEPGREQAGWGGADGARHGVDEVAVAQRLVVGDVVDAGRQAHGSGRDGRGRVVVRHARHEALRGAGQRAPAAADERDHLAQLLRIGAVERREPEHDADAARLRELVHRAFGVEDAAVDPHRLQPRVLGDPPVARVLVDRREGFLHEAADVGVARGRDHDRDSVPAEVIVLAPGAGQEHAPGRARHVRRQVDEGVVPHQRGGQARAVEQVHLDRARAQFGHGGVLPARPNRAGDFMPARRQQRDDPPPHHPGRTRDEHAHPRKGGVGAGPAQGGSCVQRR